MIKKRSVLLGGRQTSLSLEDEFWDAFKFIAVSRGLLQSKLAAEVQGTTEHPNLSSSIRLYVLAYFKDQAFKN